VQKLSKAEAGRLGALKANQTRAIQKQERIAQYIKNPIKCKHCDISLEYDARTKKFCSSSCSATHNNLLRENRIVPVLWNCLHCKKEHNTVEWRLGKYCNSDCHHAHRRASRVGQWLDDDKSWVLQTPRWAKDWIASRDGYRCSICNIEEWNASKITLDCDHIDGNPTNNRPENLRLLCPNCHSQTSSFKGKNAGNGRATRYSN
jgi:hypothetical protein